MLVTELYNGQGLGNQLWAYVFTRVLALDKGFEFGIQNPEKFKGADLMQLDMGQKVMGGLGPEGGPPSELPNGIRYYYSERVIRHPKTDVDIRTVDPGFQDVVDNTKMEGVFQAEEYISHRKEEIRNWLKYEPKQLDIDFSDENVCVINFRGGEYARNPRIFLRRKYWVDAVKHVRAINPDARFVVITDDLARARRFFPRFPIRHYGISGDYQAINTARYLILSNSSFAFFPAWLNQQVRLCIAPKYWSAHNESDGYWGCGYNIVSNWVYLDRSGRHSDYQACIKEFEEYQQQNIDVFEQKRIENAFIVVSSFNHDLSWLPRYSDNYLVFEQGNGSGIPPQLDVSKLRTVTNNGSNYRDYFDYIIENYDNLPEVIFLIKGNVFPRHVRQHVFDTFVPQTKPTSIVDQAIHQTTIPLDFFDQSGRYCEINSDAFARSGAPSKYFVSLDDFYQYFDKRLTSRLYTHFSIGGQYVTTREQVRSLPKWIYVDLREIVSHGGGPIGYTIECWIVERGLDRLWESSKLFSRERNSHSLSQHTGKNSRWNIHRRLLLALLDVVGRGNRFLSQCALTLWSVVVNRLKILSSFLNILP